MLYLVTGVLAVLVSLAIVWFCFMDHAGAEETYAVGFHFTPDPEPFEDE